MKHEKTYLIKKTINNILNLIVVAQKEGTYLANDIMLAKSLNVSRTTIREALGYLCDNNIIKRTPRSKAILRLPQDSDYFDLDNCAPSKSSKFKTYFLNLLKSGELRPGDKFFELELAKLSGCTTITIREFLNSFATNGLIEKIPRSGWKVVELDEKLIRELTEYRVMVEMNSMNKLIDLPDDNSVWENFREMLTLYKQVRDNFEQRYGEFQELDSRFHHALVHASNNRFTNKFFDIVLFVFHYYFLWNEKGRLTSIKVDIEQHIELLTHILSRDIAKARSIMENHILTTQKNLLGCAKNLNARQNYRLLNQY